MTMVFVVQLGSKNGVIWNQDVGGVENGVRLVAILQNGVVLVLIRFFSAMCLVVRTGREIGVLQNGRGVSGMIMEVFGLGRGGVATGSQRKRKRNSKTSSFIAAVQTIFGCFVVFSHTV